MHKHPLKRPVPKKAKESTLPGKPSRVLVLWADRRSANFGVRVLADGMAELARDAWGSDIEIQMQDFAVGDSDVSFFTRSVLRDFMRKNGPIKQKLRQYDLILDSGAGDSFTDIYGLRRLAVILYVQNIAVRLRIPIVMGPQTIGPFNRGIARWAASRSLQRMSAVVARDQKSAGYARHMGREVDAVSTDVVFALPQPSESSNRDIVLNISGLLWSDNGHVDSMRYRRELIKLVTSLHRQGRVVSLMAHVADTGNPDSDVYAVLDFKRENFPDLEILIPPSLQEARAILSSANLVIGSRMHACLNALSCGTPAIAWAYSRKFKPLMEDLGWDCVIDLTDTDISPAAQTVSLISSADSADLAKRAVSLRMIASQRLNEAITALQRAH